MKYVYIFLGVVAFVAILILFFQLLTGIFITVPFFTKWIDVRIYITTVIVLAYLSGIFFTLGISKFMSSNNMDDDFDL